MAITIEHQGAKFEFPDTANHATIQKFVSGLGSPSRRTEPEMSKLESFARGGVEGATFGFDDEIGFDKNRREQSKRDNPWTHFAGEMVGGIAPMLATGGAAAALKGGTTVASKGAQLANRMINPAAAETVGGAVMQGAKVGAAQGALSGAGHAEVGDSDSWGDALGKRASGAAVGSVAGAAIGGVVGVPAHYAGQALGRYASVKSAANDEMSSPERGALMAINRGMTRDRLTDADLRQSIGQYLPDEMPGLGIDRIESIIKRSSAGESAEQIAAGYGAGRPGVEAVQTVIDQYAARQAPLNLVDHASLARTGAGRNMQMTMRAAAATPGGASAEAGEQLLQRGLGTGSRLTGGLERFIGSSDYDGVATAAAGRHDAAQKAAYGQAALHEQPLGTGPQDVLTRWGTKFENMRGPVPEGIMKAVDSQYVKKPVASDVAKILTEAAQQPHADRMVMFQMWKDANKHVAQPESLASFIVRNGGIRDPGGDVLSMLGSHKMRPGLINKNGRQLDEMTNTAWEHGFIDGDTRPAITSLLHSLDADVRGNTVVRRGDQHLVDSKADQIKMMEDLRDVGVVGPKFADVLDQLGLGVRKGGAGYEVQAPQNLEQFQSARQSIRHMMEDLAKSNPRSPLLSNLRQFYREYTESVVTTNPAWGAANEISRDGTVAREAMEAGSRMALKLGSASREDLLPFLKAKQRSTSMPEGPQRDAALAEMEMFRVGWVRNIHDLLVMNKQAGHDLVAQMRLPAFDRLTRIVVGEEKATEIRRLIAAESAMHRTKSSLAGSQTAALNAAMQDLNQGPNMAAVSLLTNPVRAIQGGIEHVAGRMNADRNNAMMPMLTNMSPFEQLRMLDKIKEVGDARARVSQQVTMPTAALAGSFANLINSGDGGQRDRR